MVVIDILLEGIASLNACTDVNLTGFYEMIIKSFLSA